PRTNASASRGGTRTVSPLLNKNTASPWISRVEEFVRSGPSHHRQVDEQEFARSREAIKLLVNPGSRGPRHFVLEANRGQGNQGLLDDEERLCDRRRVVEMIYRSMSDHSSIRLNAAAPASQNAWTEGRGWSSAVKVRMIESRVRGAFLAISKSPKSATLLYITGTRLIGLRGGTFKSTRCLPRKTKAQDGPRS